MRIGTPLSKNATKVMLLGSGELGKEVIIALQRLGVEVIAVDRYENAPGQQVAHRAYTLDMTDGEAIKSLVYKENPQFIVPEIEAIATDALAELARVGTYEIIPTARAVQLTMNREGIRRLAAETLEIPTSRFSFAQSLNELYMAIDGGIGYPCIIKPVMSSSGKGQSRIEEPEDIEAAWNRAMCGGRVRHGRVIVEEVIAFDYEITLLTVRAVGASGKVETFFCEPIGHLQKNGDYIESWQPQIMSEQALLASQQMASKVTSALGGRGLFGVEFFVKGERVWFSEVSPRPHDTGMVTMVSQHQNEFELHARAILGLPVTTALRSPGASAVIYGSHEAKGIAFDNLDAALAVPNTDLRLFGKPESFAYRRMGVALAYGEQVDDARLRAKKVASLVKPVV